MACVLTGHYGDIFRSVKTQTRAVFWNPFSTKKPFELAWIAWKNYPIPRYILIIEV